MLYSIYVYVYQITISLFLFFTNPFSKNNIFFVLCITNDFVNYYYLKYNTLKYISSLILFCCYLKTTFVSRFYSSSSMCIDSLYLYL